MIKEFSISDTPEIVELLVEFSKEADQELILGHFLDTWYTLEQQGLVKMFGFFDDDNTLNGTISVIITPDLRTGKLTATEVFWFVTEEKRNTRVGYQLLKHLIKWAEGEEIENLIMVHLEYMNEEKLESLYTKLGFKALEKHYILRVA